MKRIFCCLVMVFSLSMVKGQAPHLFEHTYPLVAQEDVRIRALMDQVSSDSLTATIEHLQSYHTRQWNSQMVYQVQDWLVDTYHDWGFDTVYLHDFPVVYPDSIYETSDNVIAVKRGTLYPDEFVVCGAHYDSYNKNAGLPDLLRAPGADDNASGVSGILETARLLCHCNFERSVMFCHFAAEEIGLVGSEAFAKDCAAQLIDIVGYFNLDMIGYLEEGNEIKVNLLYTSQDSLLAQYVKNFSRRYFPEMPIYQSWLEWGDSDYSSFNRSGYPAIHTFEDTHHSSPFIHTPDDILGVSVNSIEQAQRFTELNLGLVATLAGLVSTSVEETGSEQLVVFPNPAKGLVTLKGVSMRQVEVYNLLGQRVAGTENGERNPGGLTDRMGGTSEYYLKIGDLVPGIYVVRVVCDDGTTLSRKLIVSGQ